MCYMYTALNKQCSSKRWWFIKTKNPKYWTISECVQCGVKFDVYRNQVKKGKGKFCSVSCGMTYRNTINNPTRCKKVREKISRNHADVSGINNPMYGIRGEDAPGYIDGRNSYVGETSRRIALANFEHKCTICGVTNLNEMDVHHIDRDRGNNKLENLMLLCTKCHQNIMHPRDRDSLGRYI